jgi:hypothetical protein
VPGDALQAIERQHEQGGFRGVLPGSWNSAHCVSGECFDYAGERVE